MSIESDRTRASARAFLTFARWSGPGLVVAGVLWAAATVIDRAAGRTLSAADWVELGLRFSAQVIVFAIIGSGLSAWARFATSSMVEFLDRLAVITDQIAGREVTESAPAAAEGGQVREMADSRSATARALWVAEIEVATRNCDWEAAETRLRALAVAFPDDPELARLEKALSASRSQSTQEQLAQLEAARGVNDPDRVLELYRGVLPTLEPEQRTALESDVARWFLNLIHRRLRTGKVQMDVVRLAGQFSETFAGTVEGASVRASLPTLRRSVGLCPRCAGPYTGIGDACPNCRKSADLEAPVPSIEDAVP
jgi:hypothetical protein